MTTYLIRCTECGANTSKQYARKNNGRCKACVTGVTRESDAEYRTRTIIDHGYAAYAREEGHYDIPDNY